MTTTLDFDKSINSTREIDYKYLDFFGISILSI